MIVPEPLAFLLVMALPISAMMIGGGALGRWLARRDSGKDRRVRGTTRGRILVIIIYIYLFLIAMVIVVANVIMEAL